jgi:sugar phosphate permease
VDVERTLGISNAEAGAISATYGVLFIIGSFFWGILADKIGLRKSLTLACLMLSIGTIAMGTINSTATGIIVNSLIGFAAGAPITLSIILTGTWFDKRKRGIAQSYMSNPYSLWMSMLGIMVPIIMLAYGWRNVWYILGAASLLLSIVVYALIRNNPQEKGLSPCGAQSKDTANTKEASQQTAPQQQVKSIDVIKMGITWHLGAVFILTVFIVTILTFFVVTYLITEVGLTPIAAGGAFSIFSLTMMAGGFVWAFISDHVPRKYVVSTGSILYALLLLALISFGKEATAIYIIVGAMGFAIGIPAVTFAMIPDHFPKHVIGTASGLVNAISGVGFILGPLIAGNIATTTGSFTPAFQIAAVMAVVLAVVSLALKRPAKHATNETY